MIDDLYLKAWRDAVYAYGGLSSDCDEELSATAILRERFVPRVTGPHDGLIERLKVQKVPDEMESHELALADFEHGYEMCVLDGRHAAAAIASLQAELVESEQRCATMAESRRLAVKDLSELQAELDEAREALRFYARENSWKSCGMYMSGRPNPSSAEIDAGRKARAALGDKQ